MEAAPHDPAIPFLDLRSRKLLDMLMHGGIYKMLTLVLLAIVKTWKQSKCLMRVEEINCEIFMPWIKN